MSDLQRRKSSSLSRSGRVDRAYRLTLATAVTGIGGIVLLIAGAGGLGILLLVVAAVCGFLLKRTLGR